LSAKLNLYTLIGLIFTSEFLLLCSLIPRWRGLPSPHTYCVKMKKKLN